MAETTAPSAIPAKRSQDSDSEWEYEYSTTETETHLVTLDLSIPDFLRRQDEYVVHNTRGGFRSWMNPLPRGNDDDEDENNNNNPDPTSNPTHPADQAKAPTEDKDPTEIQILEMHSTRPLLSYKGIVFAGTWTETVGTEMLFIDGKERTERLGRPDRQDWREHGSDDLPLPGVRHLKQDVDLIGASTARLACTPVELQRRQAAKKPEASKSAAAGKARHFSIPVATGASEQRQRQASFLESLMDIKRRRGERDVVTVLAVETKQDTVQDDVEEERLRRKKEDQFVRYKRRLTKLREESSVGSGSSPAAGHGDLARMAVPGTATPPFPSSPGGTPATPATPSTRRRRPRSSIARFSGGMPGEDEDHPGLDSDSDLFVGD